jgi:hypothetical protein
MKDLTKLAIPDAPVEIVNSWFLGLYSLSTVLDRAKKAVTVTRKFLWFLKAKRTIPFADIRCVAYNYQARGWGSDSSVEDHFTIGLRLQDGSYVHCLSRAGTAAEEASRTFATWLAEIVGAPLSR